ncbi:hypothetical protein J6590_030450 [Homalodisca vitripennis]|nr:hypothetical protein J6590_030450 [Homalodisca vitripennis]
MDHISEKIIEVFEREIDRELAERMVTVSTISDNIKICQKQLDRLRKEAVVKFYTNPCQNSETEQPSIHPAVKKLIGKRPAVTDSTQQYLKSTASEWKRETRKRHQKKHSTTFLKHKSKNSDKPDEETSVTNENVIRPCYIPPTIPGNPQENSTLRGNTKKMHMRWLTLLVPRP